MARKGYEEHYSNKQAQNRQLMVTLKIILFIASPILLLELMSIIFNSILHHKVEQNFSILLYIVTLIFVWFRM